MKDNARKTIIKKWDSLAGAIGEQAFLEALAEQEGFQLDVFIVDSRDESSINEAFNNYGVMILDNGIYLIVSTTEIDKLATVLGKVIIKMQEYERDIKNKEKEILEDIFDDELDEYDEFDNNDLGPGVI